jgi:dinuclear metal center YbgI/SA1388 family protein
MTVREIADIVEQWAPPWTAWERDNVGLQIGDDSRPVSRVLVALDATEDVIDEAVRGNVELIITHHPLLFRAVRSITPADGAGRMLLRLAEERVAVYSAHTNLDFTSAGVSVALAEQLGLSNIRFLSPLKNMLVKIAVFVPETHVERVMEAMTQAGAGTIGNYSSCSFRLAGKGTFRGSSESTPYLGKPGALEQVDEIRLEMIAPRASVQRIVSTMKRVHPYEEVAFDVFTLENDDPNYGMGAIGELAKRQSLRSFLGVVRKRLIAERVRFTGDLKKTVKRVAVCGGSGSELLGSAINAGADAFVTADLRYHTFHDAHGRIALVDAGHWETEQVVLQPLARRLRAAFRTRSAKVSVAVTRHSTNPIHYF